MRTYAVVFKHVNDCYEVEAAMYGAMAMMSDSLHSPWYGKGRSNHKSKSKTAHKRKAEKKARKIQRRNK